MKQQKQQNLAQFAKALRTVEDFSDMQPCCYAGPKFLHTRRD